MDDYVLVKAGSRKRNLTAYKVEYARVALELKYTNKEIGENIKTTESASKELITKYGRWITVCLSVVPGTYYSVNSFNYLFTLCFLNNWFLSLYNKSRSEENERD